MEPDPKFSPGQLVGDASSAAQPQRRFALFNPTDRLASLKRGYFPWRPAAAQSQPQARALTQQPGSQRQAAAQADALAAHPAPASTQLQPPQPQPQPQPLPQPQQQQRQQPTQRPREPHAPTAVLESFDLGGAGAAGAAGGAGGALQAWTPSASFMSHAALLRRQLEEQRFAAHHQQFALMHQVLGAIGAPGAQRPPSVGFAASISSSRGGAGAGDFEGAQQGFLAVDPRSRISAPGEKERRTRRTAFFHALFLHRLHFREFHRRKHEVLRKLKAGVEKQLRAVEGERVDDEKTRDREEKRRIRSLRDTNMPAYLELVKQKKDERMRYLADETARYIKSLGERIGVQREAMEAFDREAAAAAELKAAKEAKRAARAKDRLLKKSGGAGAASAAAAAAAGGGDGEAAADAMHDFDESGAATVMPSSSSSSRFSSSLAVPAVRGEEHVDDDDSDISDDEGPSAAALASAAARANAGLAPAQQSYTDTAHRIKELVATQPKLVTGGELKRYQLEGLQWLVSLYNNSMNGVRGAHNVLSPSFVRHTLNACPPPCFLPPPPHLSTRRSSPTRWALARLCRRSPCSRT